MQVGKRIGDPAAEGRRKQQGRSMGRAAWIGTGREGGGRKERGWRGRDATQQLHTQQVQPTAGDWE